MNKLLKIGIVGCGAIGSSLARTIYSDFTGQAQLSALFDIDENKARNLAGKIGNKDLVVLSPEELIAKSDFVIEATRAADSFAIARRAISSSKDVMIMSVGGVIQSYEELIKLARDNQARIYIPSGAICGIDGLKAAACGKITKVTLTTKKPPQAFAGVPYVLEKKIGLANLSQDTLIFEGNAQAATKLFPQNINVAAVLSLAGIGAEKTVVRILASPSISRNIHEIEIDSAAGRIITRTENLAHPDNPKTSYLAVLSAVACLRQILEPARIGT